MDRVLQHEEWLVGDVPVYLKFWAKLTPIRNGDFQTIFACCALLSEKKLSYYE